MCVKSETDVFNVGHCIDIVNMSIQINHNLYVNLKC